MLPLCATLQSCPGVGGGKGDGVSQPGIGVRTKSVLSVDGLKFRDANGNGRLEPYEDWRLSARERATDLVGRMTLQEKAGLMLIDTLNAGCAGTLPPEAEAMLGKEHMRRFILPG